MNIPRTQCLRSGFLAGFSGLRSALLAAILAWWPCAVLAQAPEPAPAAAPAAPVAYGRNYTIDAGLVVVLFGAAVFAVCRTSQRV
jgi:hypothetical protein